MFICNKLERSGRLGVTAFGQIEDEKLELTSSVNVSVSVYDTKSTPGKHTSNFPLEIYDLLHIFVTEWSEPSDMSPAPERHQYLTKGSRIKSSTDRTHHDISQLPGNRHLGVQDLVIMITGRNVTGQRFVEPIKVVISG